MRYIVTVRSGSKVVLKEQFKNYDDAMNKMDVLEDRYPNCSVEFKDKENGR